MAQWSSSFQTTLDAIRIDATISGASNKSQQLVGLLHHMLLSWKYEDNSLVWATTIPGGNIFGSQVVFVNDEVLSKLQWTFAEWESGIGPTGIFNAEDTEMVTRHLSLKSTAPVLARVRKKTTPNNQDGDPYHFYFRYDLPYNLRLTVATVAPKGIT